MSMSTRIKELWTKALRSGDYQQGAGQLRKTDRGIEGLNSFCCLGVLCDIYAKEGNDSHWGTESDAINGIFYAGKEHAGGVLPQEVVRWAGLPSSNPRTNEYTYNGAARLTLAEVNDIGKTFEEIANIIEETF